MRLSSAEEYGLRCLVHVARNEAAGPVPIQSIAASEGLSPEYVAKLLRLLRKAELLTSTRGAAGGYQLARPAGEITMLQVLEALDGELLPDDWCGKHAGKLNACVHHGGCNVVGLWRYLSGLLGAALTQITLDDLMSGRLALMSRIHDDSTPSQDASASALSVGASK